MLTALAVLALALPRPAASDTVAPRAPYWQQRVAYDITAALDESAGVLSGAERIVYVNRSPDTLTTFSLHLYLNAFRPGSRWADADSVEGRRRFNDLKDPDFAFNHVRDVRIMGRAVQPAYPFAPDSTIVRFTLPRALPPGDSMVVEMGWDARPSTTPRRQGRQGRRFDFAQWYPKVVVYDRYGWAEHPVYPGGEFYGEFGTFRVQLDVADDQVVGATGVVVCGDPGWERANRQPARAVEYQRDFYGARGTAAAEGGCDGAAAGRKRMVWYAEDVHHFAMSLNPQYRYEGGRFHDVAVHVLYQPGDTASWGNGVAVARTETALAWLDRLYGTFAWPQITNVHRIEGGGTEFPMMVHDGSADQGLIVHEVGHNYTMGILANNEWKEGWLDEGFTSFSTSWFWETAAHRDGYPETERQNLDLELQGYAEPASVVSEMYRDFVSYNLAIYSRGELFFHELRHLVGDDVMHRILRTFYDRWKLKHVDEAAFRDVAEEVSGRGLTTFFAGWLHTVALVDYAVGRTRVMRSGAGFTTRVEVVRKGEGRIPVDVAIIAAHDTALARAEGAAEREWVEIATQSEPREVIVDPAVRAHDWNMLNNRKRLGRSLVRLLLPPPGTELYLDPFFAKRERRDRLTVGVAPVVWYNDAGGATLGVRARDDYLGLFEQNQTLVTYGTGWGTDEDVKKADFFVRVKNPVWLRLPNLAETLDAFRQEGRYGGRLALDWARQSHIAFGPTHRVSAAIQWVAIDDARYLDPGYYEPVGTVEATLGSGVEDRAGSWQLAAHTTITGGVAYAKPGLLSATGGSGADEIYGRVAVDATARRALGRQQRWNVGARLFAGATLGNDAPVKQRQTYLAGADPYEQLANPFLRSRGALLVRKDVNYTMPGGAGLRGYDPRLSTIGVVAGTAELERVLRSAPRATLFSRVAVAAFGDAGHAISDGTILRDIPKVGFLADAGVGLRAEHRIGDTRIITRVDFPLYVSRPELAQDTHPGTDRVGFRWQFSFGAAF